MSLAFFCVCLYIQLAGLHSLYRGVKDTLENCSTKRVVWSLLKIINNLLTDMVIVLWRINFKCIRSLKEHFCRLSCYPCLVVETRTEQWRKWLYSSYHLSFVNALDRTSIQCFQIESQGPLLHSCSFARFRRD